MPTSTHSTPSIADALTKSVLNSCMLCRQHKAEHLTAVALGIGLSRAIADATGRNQHTPALAAAASNHDWQLASRLVHDLMDQPTPDPHPSRLPALSRCCKIQNHAAAAVHHLRMAQRCLDGTLNTEPVSNNPQASLWDHQVKAITNAVNALSYDQDVLTLAASAATSPCTHPQALAFVKANASQFKLAVDVAHASKLLEFLEDDQPEESEETRTDHDMFTAFLSHKPQTPVAPYPPSDHQPTHNRITSITQKGRPYPAARLRHTNTRRPTASERSNTSWPMSSPSQCAPRIPPSTCRPTPAPARYTPDTNPPKSPPAP